VVRKLLGMNVGYDSSRGSGSTQVQLTGSGSTQVQLTGWNRPVQAQPKINNHQLEPSSLSLQPKNV